MAVKSIVAGSGSKKKSGGEWKDIDFWKYENEESTNGDIKTWGTEEDAKKLREQIEKAHGIKLQ